jgi:hypothetical protein
MIEKSRLAEKSGSLAALGMTDAALGMTGGVGVTA